VGRQVPLSISGDVSSKGNIEITSSTESLETELILNTHKKRNGFEEFLEVQSLLTTPFRKRAHSGIFLVGS
jgi:hypothetical protein